MHASNRPKVLTRHVGTRLTPDEAKRLEMRAQEQGLTASEWLRQVTLQVLEFPSAARLLLAEMMSLRKIVLALHADLLQGQRPTEQRVREVIEHAESTKFAMADNRIQAFRSRPSNE
jgi:hypothetical protein